MVQHVELESNLVTNAGVDLAWIEEELTVRPDFDDMCLRWWLKAAYRWHCVNGGRR